MPIFFTITATRVTWSSNASRLWQVLLCSVLVLSIGIDSPVQAASFTIASGTTETAAQTLNANETGTIEIGGELVTGGGTAPISAVGTDVNISNNGTISSVAGDGILSNAANVNVTNSGKISTTGGAAEGINSSGINAIITNSGTVSTTGGTGDGILSTGANANITNSGKISTTGGAAEGINSSGINVSITNSGEISTTNGAATGILSDGANASITNSGTISTTGANADGILSTGANANISNKGRIYVTGNTSSGVEMRGVNTIFSNSGLISATSSATTAILGNANNQTVNLQTGSQIIGIIDLGAGTDTFNVLGLPLGSSQMTLTGVETITLGAGLPGVVNGNSITTVDPTGQSIQGTTLNHLTSSFHNVISQRMAQTKALPPIQLASLELAPGMLFQERAPIVWGEVFGSHRKRGNDGLSLAYTHDYKGFTGGYEQDFHKARIGLMGGFANSSAATDTTSIATDTYSFFGGVYGHWYLGPVNLTTTLSAGFEDHDNERTVIDNLAGSETARSDFTSVFFSPSVTLSSAYKMNPIFELRPSATLIYNVAWYDDYNETGTTRSNLSIDNRTSQTLNGRIQLAVATMLNDTSEFELRSGFTTRHTFDSDTNVSLSGSSFSYASAGDDSVQGGFVGGNLRFNTTDSLDVIADVEYREASGDEDEIAARLRFEYRF